MRIEFEDDDFPEISMEGAIRSEMGTLISARVKQVVKDSFDKEYSARVDEKVSSEVERKLVSFMTEDVAITDKWGKKSFVGSVEDLIKGRIDEKILRPVDSSGNTLSGCTSASDTWVEWAIKKEISRATSKLVEEACAKIQKDTRSFVASKIQEAIDENIKTAVSAQLAAIVGKQL